MNHTSNESKIEKLELEQVRHIEILTKEFGCRIKSIEQKLFVAIEALKDQADYGHEYSFRALDALERLKGME